jgi:UDP-GlcNAc:undecaprenyl-phosphate GlcNAc-1-phosphate transferase
MWGDIAIAFLLAFITAFVITPYTIRLAKKVGAVDYPNDRRINKKPMPRLGGLAVMAGFMVSAIYLIITMSIEKKVNFAEEGLNRKLIGCLLGAIILGITCYIDDVKDIKPLVKLAGQVIAAIVVVSSGVLIDNFTIPFKENNVMLNEVFSFVLTVGWIVGITNAINLIDGLDGLSSGITLISCISLLIIFALNESPLIAIILITALAGAIVGFLPYNFNPAKTFIGDVGSNFMGFAIAVISILGVAKTYTAIVIIAPIIVLALPIFDTLWAIVRRIVKTKSIKGVFKADKGHLHHRLMAKGYTQKQAVLILYGITATLGMVAIILLDSGIWKALSFALLVVVFVALGYKDILHLREDEYANSNEKVSTDKENNKENS